MLVCLYVCVCVSVCVCCEASACGDRVTHLEQTLSQTPIWQQCVGEADVSGAALHTQL